jgi:simple sugar transport system ATP-binding protein
VTASRAQSRDLVALDLAHISKRFGATVALDDVSFTLRPRTVHALLGENGAGKTTLMRIAFGLAAADAGEVVAGEPQRRITSAAGAIAAKIGMVHQHFTNVPAMTVAENVALGGSGRFNLDTAIARVMEIGQRTGLTLDPRATVADLPVGGQQRLEIVKALARDARTLILDEPTAVLAPQEIAELLAWLRSFANEGNAVVLITHKLREALAIADDVTVLRRGRLAFAGPAAGLTLDTLSSALLGSELEPGPTEAETDSLRGNATLSPASARPDTIVIARELEIEDDRGVKRIRQASFDVRAGEIVGIAAVEGSGQSELLRALAGRVVATNGHLDVPRAAGFVPEDRHRDAVVLDFSLAENVALKGAGARRGRVDWSRLRSRTASLIARFDVRGGDATSLAHALSGGNQQKLVLARELDDTPALLVVENPTRGLDIRATNDVHARLREAAKTGAAVVVFSSDLDEVLLLAERVVVVYAGTVRECAPDRDVVGRAMLGVA